MAVDPQLRALARRVRSLEKSRLASKQPTLGNSSIEGGALQAADVDGNLTMILGEQFDGTNAPAVVTGPTPPQPLQPLVTPMPGGLRVYWDGTFTGGDVAPMDFARVLVYAVPSSVYTGPDPLNQAIVVGTFTSATGGEITAGLDPVEHTVYLVAWSIAGKYGAASDVALGDPLEVLDEVALNAGLATKNTVYAQEAAPWPSGDTGHADDVGDLWINTTPGPGPLYDVVEVTIASGIATVRLAEDHEFVADTSLVDLTGNPIDANGVPLDVLGSFTVTSTPESDTFTFDTAAADLPLTATTGGVAQGQNVKPSNVPNIWDGTAWQNVQDSGAEAAQTLKDKVKANELDVKTLAVTAGDAYHAAYAADGRVVISDYEPTGDDVYQLLPDGTPLIDEATGDPILKNDGSLWITRTRDRTNESPNPSFEVSTAGWSLSEATIARTAAATAGDGAWAGRVTNSATVGEHRAYHTNPFTTAEGDWIALSGFVRSISGVKSGWRARLTWLDGLGATISAYNGDSMTLLTAAEDTSGLEGWQRIVAIGQAPAGAVSVRTEFVAPSGSESAVWEVDAVLVERTKRLGRYFDGDSEGGSWLDPTTPNLSASELDGGAIIRLFNLEDGSWSEKFWTADTISSVDVKVLRYDKDYERPEGIGDYFDGALVADKTLPVDKLYAPTVACGEAIAAGSLVSIVSVSGVHTLYKADADNGRPADGFVLESGVIGQEIPVYADGYNPLVSGLEPGPVFLSTTPGGVTSVPPQTAGSIVQNVGHSPNSTTLNFTAGMAVLIG